MLIVAGTFDMPPERRGEFLSARTEAIWRSRGEPGCIEYSFSADCLDAGRVRLFEIWESRAHLEDHQKAMRAATASGPEIPELQRNVSYYEIASVEPSASPSPVR